MRVGIAVLLFGAALAAFVVGPASLRAETSPQERGKYLLHAAGCIGCHTDKATLKAKGPILGGGRVLKTPFGTFYGPNITPHREHGIGRWTEAQFRRALRHGRAPSGRNYFPAFPYTSFTRMTDADISALWAYLRTVQPVNRPSRRHDLRFPYNIRFLVTFWNWLYFRRGAFRPDPSKSKDWNRGAYLVTALGHCGECHTPRGSMGGLKRGLNLSGSSGGAAGDAPNITPDEATGIGRWSTDEIVTALKLGMLPDGDFVGGEMTEVVEHGTSQLSDADLKSIVTHLKSLPPIRSKPKKKKQAPGNE